MRERFRRPLSRAKYAAMGAAVGAALGGLVSRNLASTGGAFGALAGATVGEKRVTVQTAVSDLRARGGRRPAVERAD